MDKLDELPYRRFAKQGDVAQTSEAEIKEGPKADIISIFRPMLEACLSSKPTFGINLIETLRVKLAPVVGEPLLTKNLTELNEVIARIERECPSLSLYIARDKEGKVDLEESAFTFTLEKDLRRMQELLKPIKAAGRELVAVGCNLNSPRLAIEILIVDKIYFQQDTAVVRAIPVRFQKNGSFFTRKPVTKFIDPSDKNSSKGKKFFLFMPNKGSGSKESLTNAA